MDPPLRSIERRILALLLCAIDGDRHGRLHVVSRRKAGLVDGNADATTRIDVEQWLSQRNIREGMDEGDVQIVLPNHEMNVLPTSITEFQKFFTADIGNEVSEWPVGREHLSVKYFLVELRRRKI